MQQGNQYLDNKHLLLDTCFLIKAYQNYNRSYFYFDELFFLFKENNCVPVINEFIEFEFMKGCQIPSHIERKNNFIKELSKASLFSDNKTLKTATVISNIYRNYGIKKDIGLVDCGNSAFLKKYQNNLLLLTLNHIDYPLLLHDRVLIETIDTEKEIITLAFYKFNEEKFIRGQNNLLKVNFKK